METRETTDIAVPNLNHDCLEHLFQFVAPKDWPAFVQVCKSWKLAASNSFLKLSVVVLSESLNDQGRESMSFAEFKNILELIAPQLKYANIQIGSCLWGTAIVQLGDFEYMIEIIKTTFDGSETHELMNIVAKQTENIQTLKIDSFDGVTKEDWENFFRVNPVTTFKFTIRNKDCRRSFYETYISILPKSLERVCIDCPCVWELSILGDGPFFAETALFQFLDRLPRITKLKLEGGLPLPSRLARILSKHVSCITVLCVENRISEHENYGLSSILPVIPNCINLTYLKLIGDFTLQDDLCTRIADNCRFIRRLTLLPQTWLRKVIGEKPFQTLLSLPNLEELQTSFEIILTTEAKKLKKLFLDCTGWNFMALDNLRDALALMPCLSSLSLEGLCCPKTISAVRSIKQTIFSRGQNIVLYSKSTLFSPTVSVRSEFMKVMEIPCNTQPLKGEFSVFLCDCEYSNELTLY